MDLIKPLVLASRSPRRIHLLSTIGLRPEIFPCDVPEDFDETLSAAVNAKALALRKAQCVAPKIRNGFVIGADTIVVLDGRMLGKPVDREDARRMLRLLSGHTHTVYTGFAIVDRPSNKTIADVEATQVTFRHLPPREVEEYIDGGSPMDKAGAYGIQDDYGAVFVTRIEGCFYNVVGLPLAKLYQTLLDFQTEVSTASEPVRKD
jgi:septum formation protein